MGADESGSCDTKVNRALELKEFKFRKVLGSDSAHKSMFILLDAPDGQNAILLAEKNPFPVEQKLWEKIFGESTLKQILQNDVYGSYILMPPEEFSGVKSTLIYPCTDEHILKYSEQKRFVIEETAKDYKTITLPYIERKKISLEWVYNLLDHKAEADRIVFEDPDPYNGFVLAPDLKWSGENIENLYLQAVVNRRSLKSIRDLTVQDLPLLTNIRDKGLTAITERYGLARNQVRAYFHYQPSYYHLHVHFIHISYDAPASGAAKAVLLQDVINNIALVPDYYQRSTLTFILKENDGLFALFREAKGW